MMNTQDSTVLGQLSPDAVRALPAGHVVALGSGGGQVSILSGRVWLTSPGDLDDHVLAAGESFRVVDSGPTLVEAWSGTEPAVIAWKPRTLVERLRHTLVASSRRCWDLIDPNHRLGLGSAAAIVGLVVAGALFGPVSEARVRTLAEAIGKATLVPTVGASRVLHNAELRTADRAVKPDTTRGALADGSHDGDRAQGAAPEAGRRTPGTA